VTFTSRHSAIIARHCLADGGATNAWKQVDCIPVYPLADAPPLMCFPRGCGRPVTPTISFNLLQVTIFLTKILRLHCLNRVLKGGGPGTQVPYRIYVNLGYVFACLVALAPICPLIGIYGMFYFIMFSPMLRWLLVFVYRPRWDGGGDKFPTLHHIIISSLLLGQLIIAFTLILKENIIEGLIMLFCIIPTLLFNNIILEKFLRPYEDAALLQAGRLHYNWSSKSCSCLERE